MRRLRLAATLTQEELAFRAGMDRTYLSDIERGRGNPSVGLLEALGHILKVHPALLLLAQDETLPASTATAAIAEVRHPVGHGRTPAGDAE